jgi:hypothetical protein
MRGIGGKLHRRNPFTARNGGILNLCRTNKTQANQILSSNLLINRRSGNGCDSTQTLSFRHGTTVAIPHLENFVRRQVGWKRPSRQNSQ